MYVSIPNITDVLPDRLTSQYGYTIFNVHINEMHHSSLRYSQLRSFHNYLQRVYSHLMVNIQPFPPKKFFNLSSNELDERRLYLERYLQSIVQNKSLLSLRCIKEFFLNSQYETFVNEIYSIDNEIKIYFLNHDEIILGKLPLNLTLSELYNRCLNRLNFDRKYSSYFSIFLYEKKFNLIRPLFDFEYPLISLRQAKRINVNYCFLLRKSYWNINYDFQLLDNDSTRFLVYLQSQYDNEQSKEYDQNDIYQELECMSNNDLQRDYILLSHKSKFYGYVLFKQCSLEGFQDDEKHACLLAIGNREVICCLIDENQQMKTSFTKEIVFKITRIRCWKVVSTKDKTTISFEYLVRKDCMKWITIHTKLVALLCTCLQSIVDEILTERSNMNEIEMISDTSKDDKFLTKRTQSDINRLNSNSLFDQLNGDDDL